ncbi:DUF1345 domain-containing protein [Leucobacter sp.]
MSEASTRSGVRWRWAVSAACGAVAGTATAPQLGVAAGLLAGWATLALVSSAWTLLQIWPMDAAATREHATVEDPGRRIARIIAIIGSVMSLTAVGVVIVQARNTSGIEASLLAAVAVLSVVSSWVLIQTDYLLHYARVYYEGDARGIDFNQREDPEYTDFAYFSVGLGMTYQVSDTDVTRNAIRRVVVAQTLLAYLFGAGIIATVINLIAGLT